MRALHRKLLRDTRRMAPQLAAIAVVVAAAVATYVTMHGAYEGLLLAQRQTYDRLRFARVFAHLKRAPLTLRRDILAIPGVASVDARIVADVPLDVPGLAQPASGRIVSYDGVLDLVHLRRGRLFRPSSGNEAVASELFARANHLDAGSQIGAVLNGRWEQLQITGIGTSPEYVSEVSGASVFPDHRHFGVLWMPREAVSAAFAMRGAFNDIALTLIHGADEAAVIAALDRLLAPYGCSGAYGLSEHHSHQFLESEISQDRITATAIPAIFLLVAAFLIHLVLSRLVAGQREQIAILKAFGYSSSALAMHYTGFALLVVAAGTAAGVPAGIWLGRGLIVIYRDFFNFPELLFVTSHRAIAISAGASAVAATGASILAALHAARIPPAEGMRGEQPAVFRSTMLEPLYAVLSPGTRMIVRSMERRSVRAALTMLGIAFAVMILISGRSAFDALDAIVAIHFRSAERDDVLVTFVEPRAAAVVNDLAHLPGVRRVEPFRAVLVRLHARHRSRHVALIGIERDSQLRRLVAADGSITPIPARGVVLTTRLANRLGISRGDIVRIETLEGHRFTFELPVVATTDELIGINAYIDRQELARLLRENGTVSGARMSIDSRNRDRLDSILKRLPVVAAVLHREATLQSFLETAAKSLSTSMTAIVLFACIIAFAVVYNSARIALLERSRELATLRVLGFSVREVTVLLLGEHALLTLIGIPFGFVLGHLVARWFVYLLATDAYRFPLALSGATYAFASLIVVGATGVSALAVWRRIGRLNLVEVLKARE